MSVCVLEVFFSLPHDAYKEEMSLSTFQAAMKVKKAIDLGAKVIIKGVARVTVYMIGLPELKVCYLYMFTCYFVKSK